MVGLGSRDFESSISPFTRAGAWAFIALDTNRRLIEAAGKNPDRHTAEASKPPLICNAITYFPAVSITRLLRSLEYPHKMRFFVRSYHNVYIISWPLILKSYYI
ncbi:hypothetical protein T310_10096 [Rasamsonia emersonii CBS 393.64]|uniref:Uncharacterized protein n=1 Tax=Rasamsonia emersonii (strain ATCC 16479 / CBS 393.64 / IMI 116815) TaxID=1408163 RepID=A0A0F4YFA1_RASE3|nr:hypothetical protein T310_10096 [Rasamsonia emersonii CBS 393.64]KKA16318.1 hypothetical protein T310_10096 [Rasamsonia emersonii CBS 393.64]